ETAAVEVEDQLHAVLADSPGKSEGKGDLSRLIRSQACKWIDGQDMDLFRRPLCNLLDLHSPFGRCYQAVSGGFTVKGYGKIELAGDLDSFFYEYPPNAKPFGPGLR